MMVLEVVFSLIEFETFLDDNNEWIYIARFPEEICFNTFKVIKTAKGPWILQSKV